MSRIGGMLLGFGFLVGSFSLALPAFAGDRDTYSYTSPRQHGGPFLSPPIGQQPQYAPPRYVDRYDHFPGEYAIPQYPHFPRSPIAPPPLPPEAFQGGYRQIPSEPQFSPAPPIAMPPHERPGQFVNAAVPLYPFVRVKDGKKAPPFGIHQIVAVRSPDPFRFPGCVYVQVCVPPGPCRKVKVEDGGAKIELDYGDYEVEIKSKRGEITVEYDD